MHQSGHGCKKSLGLSTETPGVLTPSYEQVGPNRQTTLSPPGRAFYLTTYAETS